jgi:riboflavin kinase/FMN adenylyltransferase
MTTPRIIRGWSGLAAADKGAAVALGNFDGVHRGHQRVIAQAGEAARRLGAPLGVVTFDPHPRRIFQPGAPPFNLMTADQQARALGDLGVERLYLLPFTPQLAAMSDQQFATQVLQEGLGVRHVAAGFDISFGKDRTGDPDDLRRYGRALGFSVSIAEPVGDGPQEKFSSTQVRDALREGRPQDAAVILGRPFAIEGPVQMGQQLGRTLGFPTANVPLGDYVRPRFGVYAVRVRLPDGRRFDGVASLGINPTVLIDEPRLEAWIFDFEGDLYGQVIETELAAWLRPEEKFDSLQALTAQVLQDAEDAKRALAREP